MQTTSCVLAAFAASITAFGMVSDSQAYVTAPSLWAASPITPDDDAWCNAASEVKLEFDPFPAKGVERCQKDGVYNDGYEIKITNIGSGPVSVFVSLYDQTDKRQHIYEAERLTTGKTKRVYDTGSLPCGVKAARVRYNACFSDHKGCNCSYPR